MKMRDCPSECGTVDTYVSYALTTRSDLVVGEREVVSSIPGRGATFFPPKSSDRVII